MIRFGVCCPLMKIIGLSLDWASEKKLIRRELFSKFPKSCFALEYRVALSSGFYIFSQTPKRDVFLWNWMGDSLDLQCIVKHTLTLTLWLQGPFELLLFWCKLHPWCQLTKNTLFIIYLYFVIFEEAPLKGGWSCCKMWGWPLWNCSGISDQYLQ